MSDDICVVLFNPDPCHVRSKASIAFVFRMRADRSVLSVMGFPCSVKVNWQFHNLVIRVHRQTEALSATPVKLAT